MTSSEIFLRHLSDRPGVSLPPSNEPITQAKQQNKSKNRTRVVHIDFRHWLLRRKREKDADEDPVHNGKDVDVQSERTESKWSVRDWLVVDFPESKDDNRDQIRDVQRKSGQGKNRVERSSGGNVDESQKTYYDTHENDGPDRYLVIWVYLSIASLVAVQDYWESCLRMQRSRKTVILDHEQKPKSAEK